MDKRTATLATVINERMITDLPLNGRNVLQFLRSARNSSVNACQS
jgi:hypothetical protein